MGRVLRLGAGVCAWACVLTALAAGSARATTGYPGLLQNDAPPTIAGDLAVDGTVSAAPGGWSGEGPIAYAYQWQRCQPTCVNLPGVTAQSYLVGPGDASGRLRVVVTASNPSVSFPTASAVTLPVAPAAAQVEAALFEQLVPHAPPLAIAIALATRNGYPLPIDVPVAGRVTMRWYWGSHPQPSLDRSGLELVAQGATTMRKVGLGAVTMKLTTRGRALIKTSSRLVLTGVVNVSPAQSLAVSAVRVFSL